MKMCDLCVSQPLRKSEERLWYVTVDNMLTFPSRHSLNLAAAPLLSTQKSWTWLQIKHMISSSLQRRLVTHPLGGMRLLLHQLYHAL